MKPQEKVKNIAELQDSIKEYLKSLDSLERKKYTFLKDDDSIIFNFEKN